MVPIDVSGIKVEEVVEDYPCEGGILKEMPVQVSFCRLFFELGLGIDLV